MKSLTAILTIALFVNLAIGEPKRFDNYQVFKVAVKTENDLNVLRELQIRAADNEYDFWKDPILGGAADIMVPPHKLEEFKDFIDGFSLEMSIMVDNLQDLIDQESPKNRTQTRLGELNWTDYHTIEEIYAWLDVLLQQYSNILTEHRVGYSYKGVEIRGVKLSRKAGNPAMLIESNIHAREWITSATSTYILNELLTSTDPNILEISTNIDWYFIPIFNPDGFIYTKNVNRLWRKTRYPHSHLCYGVDLNRNFDFQWMHVGASQNPCDETYAGPVAFSDPESRALAAFFEERKDHIKVFIALHSYGQYILTPFGYTYDHADNYDQMVQVGRAGAAAISQKYDTVYEVGSTAELLYMNAGSSRDWLKGIHNINVSYTIEMRDKGVYGFVLPPNQILPSAIEMFDGFQAIVRECLSLGYL